MPETENKTKKQSYLGASFQFVKHMVLPFLFGIILNAIYAFVLLGGWLSGAALSESPYAILLFGLFLLVFPFLYFWLARKHAVNKGIEFLYNTSSPVTSKAVNMVVSSMVMGSQAGGANSNLVGTTLQNAKSYVQKIDSKLPRGVKMALTAILSRVPIHNVLAEVSQTMDLTEDNLPQIQSHVQSKVDGYIKDELIGSSMTWFWVLLIFNVVMMALAWWLLV